ncbi:site-specific integrase [Catellatospora sp. NPDC049111]|uniref:tyrosine-type recombinase/integrase n=1 Tax=Catellatospora sp. NPDC049111 TaxID=3155271 RepID=UPI003407B6C7
MARKPDIIKKVVLKNGATRYRFRLGLGIKPNGKVDQRTFTFDTLKEAQNELSRLRTENSQGTLVMPNRKLTVAEYMTEWLETKRSKKPSTHQGYVDALAIVIEHYGNLPLQSLDSPHLEKVKADMLSGKARKVGTKGKPLANRTVNLMLTLVTMALKVAVKRRLVPYNVGELVDRLPLDHTAAEERGAWQTDDALMFLRHVREDRLYAAWLLALLGLRRGEVLGLRWEDVDFTGDKAKQRKLPPGTPSLRVAQNRVYVRGTVHTGTPKGRGRSRSLPMPEVVITALKEHQRRQEEEKKTAGRDYFQTGLVFVNEIGEGYNPDSHSDRFNVLTKEAPVPRIPLHGARHCAASLLGDMGFPDVVVAAWLGQSQITVTHGYQHAMAERLRSAGDALGEALAI